MSRRTRSFTPRRDTAPEQTITAQDVRDALTEQAPPDSRTERMPIEVRVNIDSVLTRQGASLRATGHIGINGQPANIDIPVTVTFTRGARA